MTIADCYTMINSRRINAVPLFKRKVSSFLADGGHFVGQYGRRYQQTLERNTAYCHRLIIIPVSSVMLLSTSSLIFRLCRHRNRARAIPPVRSHWRGQCSIMHSINIKSRSFRIGSRNDAFVMKAITICDKPDSYIRFIVEVFFLTVLSIDISFALSLLRDPEENSSSIFVRRLLRPRYLFRERRLLR